MAWFSGKKKPKRKPPVLEPVGNPAVQAAPAAVQAAPVAQPAPEPVQPNQGMPAVQAAPATIQAVPPMQPIVEVAPIGAVADSNVTVSAEPVTATPQQSGSTDWSKKSKRPLMDIHKRLDHMMDSKGKSLEERYKDRFGDKLPESVATDSARKEYNEKKANKPEIVFKPRSSLKLKPRKKKAPKVENKIEKKAEEKKDKDVKASNKIGDRLKSSGAITKSAIGNASSAVGRGAGAVKSGIGRGAGAVSSGIGKGAGAVKSGIGIGASKVMGLFGRGSDKKEVSNKDYSKMKVAELKNELKEKGLSTAGKKADLIKRLSQ